MTGGEFTEKNKFVLLLVGLVLLLLILAAHAAWYVDPAHTKMLDFCLTKAGEVIAAFLTLVIVRDAPQKHDTEIKEVKTVTTDTAKN